MLGTEGWTTPSLTSIRTPSLIFLLGCPPPPPPTHHPFPGVGWWCLHVNTLHRTGLTASAFLTFPLPPPHPSCTPPLASPAPFPGGGSWCLHVNITLNRSHCPQPFPPCCSPLPLFRCVLVMHAHDATQSPRCRAYQHNVVGHTPSPLHHQSNHTLCFSHPPSLF
jgi:hypothetical protein